MQPPSLSPLPASRPRIIRWSRGPGMSSSAVRCLPYPPICPSVGQIAQGLADLPKCWPIRSRVCQIAQASARSLNSLPQSGRLVQASDLVDSLPARQSLQLRPVKSKAVPGSGVLGSEVDLPRPCKAVARFCAIADAAQPLTHSSLNQW